MLEEIDRRDDGQVPEPVEAHIEQVRASILFSKGEFDRALDVTDSALQMYENVGDNRGITWLRERRGHIFREIAALDRAREDYR